MFCSIRHTRKDYYFITRFYNLTPSYVLDAWSHHSARALTIWKRHKRKLCLLPVRGITLSFYCGVTSTPIYEWTSDTIGHPFIIKQFGNISLPERASRTSTLFSALLTVTFYNRLLNNNFVHIRGHNPIPLYPHWLTVEWDMKNNIMRGLPGLKPVSCCGWPSHKGSFKRFANFPAPGNSLFLLLARFLCTNMLAR